MDLTDIPPYAKYEPLAISAVYELLKQGRRVIIAYSGGKDSTAVMILALKAARRAAEEGLAFPAILITHGDTGIENPMVSDLAAREMMRAVHYGLRYGFKVQPLVAHPLLNDTWAVSILSGRKLPTFASSPGKEKKDKKGGTRDCTTMLKVTPMKRLRNLVLRGDKKAPKGMEPVTLIGTRMDESDGRATRMTERGETAYTPWKKAGASYMSVIANWEFEDVWSYLAQFRDGKDEAYTDTKEVWEMYSDGAGGNVCTIVADMATEGAKKSRACGARFGCFLCAAVGRDKSLESMLLQPKYDWLRHINRIQRFIVDTRYDWSRRNWVGRTVNNGYIKIQPDTYSPQMLQDLLRYCLTADLIEERAAERLGIAPRFKIVPMEALLAIDALWSIYGIQQRAFTAIKIWHEIHVEGKRYYAPELAEPVPRTPQPKARYMYVGESWDGENGPQAFTGMRDVLAEEFGGPGCVGARTLDDGRTIVDVPIANSFRWDAEATDLFFQFEVDYVLRNYYEGTGSNCTAGIFHYTRLNMLSLSKTHVQNDIDRVMRRTAWKHRNGLVGTNNPEQYLPRTISEAELKALIGEEAVAALDDIPQSDGLDAESELAEAAEDVRAVQSAAPSESEPVDILPVTALADEDAAPHQLDLWLENIA